jgi:hypothetical protein
MRRRISIDGDGASGRCVEFLLRQGDGSRMLCRPARGLVSHGSHYASPSGLRENKEKQGQALRFGWSRNAVVVVVVYSGQIKASPSPPGLLSPKRGEEG